MTRQLAVVQRDARLVLDRDAATGITSGLSLEGGTMVLELKVPLAQTDATPYAVGARPGSVTGIGIGIETPEVDREALRAQGGLRGGQRGGARGSGGRAGGGGQGGGNAGQRGDALAPVSTWVRAALDG